MAEGMVNITVTPQDIAAVAQAAPLIPAKLRTTALIRVLGVPAPVHAALTPPRAPANAA